MRFARISASGLPFFSTALVVAALWLAPGGEVIAQDPARPPVGALPAGPGRIGGIILSAAGEPLPAAAITIRAVADSSIAAGGMSTKDGRFRIEGLQLGKYKVRISQIGHNPFTSSEVTLTAAAPTVELGSIRLELAPVALANLEVQADKAPVVMEVDRTVYNPKQMPGAAAGKAIDVLRNIPELEVDFNGKITLRGNQAVAIQINGRPAPLRGEALTNFLQQLQGDRLAKVEVMPNPSAKQDPEGMGGIVNIVLRDDLELGLSGNLSAGGGTRGSRNVGGRINYQKGPFTFFTGLSFNFQENESRNYDLRQNLLATPVTLFEQIGNSDNNGHGRFGDLTAELRVGKQATLWGSFWGFTNGSDNDGLTAYGIFDEDRILLDRYDRASSTSSHFGNSDMGLGFKQVFTPGRHELTIDLRRWGGGNGSEARVLKYGMLDSGELELDPSEVRLSDNDTDNGTLTVQADYMRPLGAKGKVDIGYRTMQRDEDYDNVLDVFDAVGATNPFQTDRSRYAYDENFHSLYTTVGQTFGKISAQLGLRAELARTTFALPVRNQSFDNDYNSIFPSGNISYNFGNGRTARLSYSKRIQRPSPWVMNPEVPATDPVNRTIGNPDIRPSYTHSFNMDLSWIGQKGTLRLAPYYRKSIDVWEQFKTVDALGVSTVTWKNMASAQSYGSNLTVSLRPVGRLSGSVTTGAYREVRDASNIDTQYSRNAWLWTLSGNVAAKFSKTMNAQAFAFYWPARILPQGKSSAMIHNNIGIRQQIYNNKGSINLSINDPFNMARMRFQTSDNSHTQISRTNYRSRAANLSLTYNFGKPPEQKSRRNSGDEAAPSSVIR